MPNIHPLIVHFPIVLFLFSSALTFAMLIWRKPIMLRGAIALTALALVSGFVAQRTGEKAELSITRTSELRKAIHEHEEYADKTMWTYGVVLLLQIGVLALSSRKKTAIATGLKVIALAGALLGAYLIYQTGDHGGMLVYKHGAGVQMQQPAGDMPNNTQSQPPQP